MQTFLWDTLWADEKRAALSRPTGLTDKDIVSSASKIMDDVREWGDAAALDYTRRFDAPKISTLSVDMIDCKAAWDAMPANQQAALKTAKANIEKFHAAQKPQSIEIETMPGVMCRREPRPMQTVGLYVPGGTAPLVSTLLMLAVPAKVADVPRRVVVTPPGQDGKINPAILAAAYLCEVTDIFAVGGAQAIAALTYGTDTIPRCDKIFGPGNAYVAAAKSQAAQIPGGPAIDLPAGPSEAMVVADSSANPVFVASDLLSQAEHDTLAQVICVTSHASLAKAISDEVTKQIKTLPRADIARVAIANSRMFIANDPVDIINAYAPEHLILQTEQPTRLASMVINAGSIFLGPWTPESIGDYASGTNHTLPTNGAARNYSGVTLESFFKFISIQSLTKEGLKTLGPTVEVLADMEGLEAHRRAVSLRLEALNE